VRTRLSKKSPRSSKRRNKPLNRLVENDLIRKVSLDEYQEKVRNVYGGPKGALLATCSKLSLHSPLGERIFRERRFDLRGCRRILDVGSGAGQIAKHLLKYSDRGAKITCSDLSREMLRRARIRLKSQDTKFVTSDLAQLPFADESFDAVTCGFVLEHLPDPLPGLTEMSRVLTPGGRLLLLTTEDNFSGAWTSRMWYCRTYNRAELKATCHSLGLIWRQEIWYTRMHKVLRAGGICVEIVKQ
jgi:ubiquinone/menaquinone biosynthesis C-methylase UbiE